jgi:hypothetical protein
MTIMMRGSPLISFNWKLIKNQATLDKDYPGSITNFFDTTFIPKA